MRTWHAVNRFTVRQFSYTCTTNARHWRRTTCTLDRITQLCSRRWWRAAVAWWWISFHRSQARNACDENQKNPETPNSKLTELSRWMTKTARTPLRNYRDITIDWSGKLGTKVTSWLGFSFLFFFYRSSDSPSTRAGALCWAIQVDYYLLHSNSRSSMCIRKSIVKSYHPGNTTNFKVLLARPFNQRLMSEELKRQKRANHIQIEIKN